MSNQGPRSTLPRIRLHNGAVYTSTDDPSHPWQSSTLSAFAHRFSTPSPSLRPSLVPRRTLPIQQSYLAHPIDDESIKSKIKEILADPKNKLVWLSQSYPDAFTFIKDLESLTARSRDPQYLMQILEAFKQHNYKVLPSSLCSSSIIGILSSCHQLVEPLIFMAQNFNIINSEMLIPLLKQARISGNHAAFMKVLQNIIDHRKANDKLDTRVPHDKAMIDLLLGTVGLGVEHSAEPLKLLLQLRFEHKTLVIAMSKLLDWVKQNDAATENVQQTYEHIYQAGIESFQRLINAHQTLFNDASRVMQQRWPQEGPERASVLASMTENSDTVLMAFTMQKQNNELLVSTSSVEETDRKQRKRLDGRDASVEDEASRRSKRLKNKK